jgi:alpha-tubulin suppressor-like RCC1 family protein
VSGIAAGRDDTCARTRSQAVWCWGYNHFGQLGDGTTHDRHTPVAVTGLPAVAALALGPLHTCALTVEAGVVCWGENFDGELGDGTKTNRVRPVSVSGLPAGVTAITAGGWESDTGTLDEYTCALTVTGAISCWGGNFDGYLGDGSTHNREMPVNVTGFRPKAALGGVTLERGPSRPANGPRSSVRLEREGPHHPSEDRGGSGRPGDAA